MTDARAIIDEPDEDAWAKAAALLDEVPALRDAGDVERAEVQARDAHAALVRIVGKDHPDVANALDTLGTVLAAAGRYAEAIDTFRAAHAIFDLWRDEEAVHPMRAAALGNLAYFLTQQGAYDEARARQQEAIDLAIAVYGADAREVALAHNGMGVCLKMQGAYDGARAAYGRAVDVWTARKEPLPSSLHHNLAGLAAATGDGKAAERHARAAIARRREEGGDAFGLGTDIAGLGDALMIQGRAKDAEDAFRDALGYLRARPDHPEVAYALHNLGDALAAQHKVDDARRAYQESIARKRAALGPDHFEIAATEANLAALLAEHGDKEAARALVATARRRAQALPAQHPVRTAIESLARGLT